MMMILSHLTSMKYKLKQRIIDRIAWGTTLLVSLEKTRINTSIKD